MSAQRFSNALFADLYELTMAQAYWQHGWQGEATFSMFFREYPPHRGYLVYAGLEDLLDYLDELRFTDEDLSYMRGTKRFDDKFLDWLGGVRFTGSVRSMTEGEIFFATEPVVEVTGPIIEAQLAETYLMNQINVQTTLATKAARVMHAGQGRQMVEFAARRTQGTDAANKLAKVSYLTGFAGTSNVQAAAIYGIPPFGTMAHSFITSFPSELEAFQAYADSFPDTSTLLVDSYDTIEGVRNAITVAKSLEEKGHKLRSIRLDSGDLLALSIEARRMLDDAGLDYVGVFASGGLDEYDVEELVDAGAPISGFGVGTMLGVSADAPWTDCAYKLVEYEGKPVMKLSTGKETLAGQKQVWRVPNDDSPFGHDVIARAGEQAPSSDAVPLLHEVVRDGKRVGAYPGLDALRERFAESLATLPGEYTKLRDPASYEVQVSPTQRELQERVRREVVARELE